MRSTWCVALSLAIVVTAACGKSEEQKQAEAAAEQVKQAAAKFEEAAKQAAAQGDAGSAEIARGLEAMAKGMAAAGAVGADGKPVEPVSFRDLQTLFPELPGWEKGKPTGEKMTSPFAFSQAEVRYTKGDSRIELKIVDSGFHQLLFAPYTMFLTSGYERETANGYEKSTTVANEPGWEKWNPTRKSGEVNAVVGKRFLVQAEGRAVDDIRVLHDAIGKTDLARLSAMK